MKKHKHNQPGKHKESEHEELIRLRLKIEFFKEENKLIKTENEFFKAENATIKKEISLREEKESAQLKTKKQRLSRDSAAKDIY